MAALAFDLSHSEASSRALLELRGPDTIRFLQGTLSNDISEIPEGEAVAAALLTVKAKLVCDVTVWGAGETLWLSVPAAVGQAVFENLDRHIIMDEVEVKLVEAKQVLVVGEAPAAADGVAVAARVGRYGAGAGAGAGAGNGAGGAGAGGVITVSHSGDGTADSTA